MRDSANIRYDLVDGNEVAAKVEVNVYDGPSGNMTSQAQAMGLGFTGAIDGAFDPNGNFAGTDIMGVELSVDGTTIDSLLALGGYDAELGARPMRRAIGRMVEAPLAAAILGGDFERGDRILAVGDADGVRFERLQGSVEAAE